MYLNLVIDWSQLLNVNVKTLARPPLLPLIPPSPCPRPPIHDPSQNSEKCPHEICYKHLLHQNYIKISLQKGDKRKKQNSCISIITFVACRTNESLKLH